MSLQSAVKGVVCLVLGVLVFCSCDGGCENDKVISTPSPNGKFKVVSFRRSCGATTGFSTQVSLLPAAKRISNDDAGNILIVGDELHLTIHWLDDQDLSISGIGSAQTFKQESTVHGIQISYE